MIDIAYGSALDIDKESNITIKARLMKAVGLLIEHKLSQELITIFRKVWLIFKNFIIIQKRIYDMSVINDDINMSKVGGVPLTKKHIDNLLYNHALQKILSDPFLFYNDTEALHASLYNSGVNNNKDTFNASAPYLLHTLISMDTAVVEALMRDRQPLDDFFERPADGTLPKQAFEDKFGFDSIYSIGDSSRFNPYFLNLVPSYFNPEERFEFLRDSKKNADGTTIQLSPAEVAANMMKKRIDPSVPADEVVERYKKAYSAYLQENEDDNPAKD
jgi:hypothetical protein